MAAGFCHQVVGATALVHLRGALEQLPDRDADHRRGKQSDRRQHAEPSADVRRNGERGDLLLAGELPQNAILRIRGEDDVAPVAIAELRLELLAG